MPYHTHEMSCFAQEWYFLARHIKQYKTRVFRKCCKNARLGIYLGPSKKARNRCCQNDGLGVHFVNLPVLPFVCIADMCIAHLSFVCIEHILPFVCTAHIYIWVCNHSVVSMLDSQPRAEQFKHQANRKVTNCFIRYWMKFAFQATKC